MFRGALPCTAVIVLSMGSTARADPEPAPSGDACTQGYEGAQKRMRAGALLQSRSDLSACESTCPRALATDCQTWRSEVERQIPSLRLSAKEADGSDPGRVRVLVDGAPLAEALPGSAIEVDPGRHTLTFEASTRQRVEVQVDVPRGRKDYAVDVRFPPRAATTRTPPPPAPPPSIAPLVVGGVGVLVLAAGGVLGVKGQVDRNNLEHTCAPMCPQSSVDAIDREWKIGAALGAVGGAAALAAGLWWGLDRRAPAAPTMLLGPGSITFVGRF